MMQDYRRSRWRYCLLLWPLILTNSALADAGSLDSRIGSLVQPLVEERLIPGFYLAIYDQDGLVFEKAEGFADEKLGIAPGPDILYHINSMSKPITSLMILRLQDMGLLSVNDPVSKYLPDFGNNLFLDDSDKTVGRSSLEPELTIKHLLTHTSGLSRAKSTSIPPQLRLAYLQDRVLTLGGVAESQLGALSMHVEKLGDIPLYAPPGQVFEYSVGFDVAARIAEIVTGKDLASVVRETVFEPLGMEDSHFYVPKDKMKRLARLYGPRGRTYQLPGKPRRYRNYVGLPKDQKNFGGTRSGYLSGSVGIITTASDYSKFMRLLLAAGEINEKQWLSRQGLDLLTRNQLPKSFDKQAMAISLPQYVNSGYSLGMAIKIKPGGSLDREDDYEYLYWASESNTQFWIDPDNNLAGIFMSQHLPAKYFVADKIHELSVQYLR
jgi:CubicO group peptidase (beta-lactamase class C family)